MSVARVDDMEIFYEVAGEGEPLLLIAGFACDHLFWRPAAEILSQRYRVISFDHRGVGRTSGSLDSMTIATLAEDAFGLVEALGLGPTHVVGHSMGGMIAQELAMRHPAQVRTLALVSTCAGLDPRGKAIIELWGELPRQTDPVTAARVVLPWLFTKQFFADAQAVEKYLAEMLGNPHPPSVEAIYAQSRAIGEFNSVDRLSGLDCPTLVVVGSEDILLPPAMSEALSRQILGSQLVVLKHSAHELPIECPAEFCEAVFAFLEEIGR